MGDEALGDHVMPPEGHTDDHEWERRLYDKAVKLAKEEEIEGEAAAQVGAMLLDALTLVHEHPSFIALARRGHRAVRLCQTSLTDLRQNILGEDILNRTGDQGPGWRPLARLQILPLFHEPDAEVGKAILACISRGGPGAEGVDQVVRNMAALGAWGVFRLQSQLRQLRVVYNGAQAGDLVYIHAPVWPANALGGLQRWSALRAAGAEGVLVRARLGQAEYDAVGARLLEELRQQIEERRQAQQSQEDQQNQGQQNPQNVHMTV